MEDDDMQEENVKRCDDFVNDLHVVPANIGHSDADKIDPQSQGPPPPAPAAVASARQQTANSQAANRSWKSHGMHQYSSTNDLTQEESVLHNPMGEKNCFVTRETMPSGSPYHQSVYGILELMAPPPLTGTPNEPKRCSELSGQLAGANRMLKLHLVPQEIHLEKTRVLGKGCTSTVYPGSMHGQPVAIKVMPWDSENDMSHEILFSVQLAHRNIVKVHGWCRCGDELWIVMTRYDGSLSRLGNWTTRAIGLSLERGPLRWLEDFSILKPILGSLVHLAQFGVSHCDVKPENVVLGWHGEVALSDFGLLAVNYASSWAAHKGTKPYMTPERWVPTPHVDLYSFGVLTLEVILRCRLPVSFDPAVCNYLDLLPACLREFLKRCFGPATLQWSPSDALALLQAAETSLTSIGSGKYPWTAERLFHGPPLLLATKLRVEPMDIFRSFALKMAVGSRDGRSPQFTDKSELERLVTQWPRDGMVLVLYQGQPADASVPPSRHPIIHELLNGRSNASFVMLCDVPTDYVSAVGHSFQNVDVDANADATRTSALLVHPAQAHLWTARDACISASSYFTATLTDGEHTFDIGIFHPFSPETHEEGVDVYRTYRDDDTHATLLFAPRSFEEEAPQQFASTVGRYVIATRDLRAGSVVVTLGNSSLAREAIVTQFTY